MLTPEFCHALCIYTKNMFVNWLQNLNPQNINNPGGFVHAHNLAFIFSSSNMFFSNHDQPLPYGKHSMLSLKTFTNY